MRDKKRKSDASGGVPSIFWLLIIIVIIVLTQSGNDHGQMSDWFAMMF